MKDNVTQLINFEWENLEKIKNDFINDPSNFSDFEKNTNDFFENVKKNFMQNMLNALDKNICESPQRKKEWYINTSDQKDYYTTSGTLTFTKTLFTNKKTKESRYLIDDILGIEPHERISDNAKAMILDEAVQTSYKRAGEVISKVDSVSKETVKNLVHSIEFPKETYENIKSKKVVPVLYIEADEDHAKLQFHNKKGDLVKGKNGRKDNGLTSKLVYVHEGTKFESSNSKRRVVINPHYFASTCTDTDNEEFWREVDAYIQAVYNTEQIPFIFLMADGGNWIKTALKYIPNLIYVLDEFHLNKYINRIANNFWDSADDVRKALRKIIEKNDYATFDNTIAQLVKTLNSTNKEKVLNDAKYILNNWDACKRRLLLKNRICGCSA